MLQETNTRRSNLSFYLGGRSPSDTEPWTPSMDAVRATVQYAISTGRLDHNPSQTPTIPHHAPSCRQQDPASIADDRTLDTWKNEPPGLLVTNNPRDLIEQS